MQRTVFVLALTVACSCSGDGGSGEGAGGNGVNVLLISLDTVRRDALSTYGRVPRHAPDTATTPHIDRLAAAGVVLEDAYTTTSWTLPSHLGLFSGEPEVVHAVEQSFHRYQAPFPLLAELMREHGYSTAGFFSGPFLEPHFGFGRGFDRYEACYGDPLRASSERTARLREERDATRARGDAEGFVKAYEAHEEAKQELAQRGRQDISSSRVTDAAMAEIERASSAGQPFFVFAHYFDAHADYVPPREHDCFDEEYTGSIDSQKVSDEGAAQAAASGAATGPPASWGTQRDLEHLVALYEGELRWTDAEVGRLLTRLDELGLADNTLVVIVADHGEEFFEHGTLGHRSTLYEEVVRVPLILRLPGVLPAGERVGGVVSTVDVPATVLELTGLPRVGGSSSASFVSLMHGEDDGATRGAFGRLVLSVSLSIPAPPGLRMERIPGNKITIVETYREGAIKVTRKRSWPRVALKVDPELDRKFAAQTERARAKEELTWIDVERHPEERPEQYSGDFSDEKARAVLVNFRERYVGLLEKRSAGLVERVDDELTTMLKGLGYTGDEGAEGEEFTLPPPGEHVLR
jgi:arylsulfatase A-like enzyme